MINDICKQNIEHEVLTLMNRFKMTLSTAESCTGGGISSLLTSISGSSSYYKGGVVAYTNEAKHDLLNVSMDTLAKYGAVSQEAVIEMVKGAIKTLHSDCAIATSGFAGPGGGTEHNPVGNIWMAAACGNDIVTYLQTGDTGRTLNVKLAIQNSLILLINLLKNRKNTTTQ